MANTKFNKVYFTDSFVLTAALAAHHIGMMGAGETVGLPTDNPDQLLLAKATHNVDGKVGERVDFNMAGFTPVKFGGTVPSGRPVTANSAGEAVLADPPDGVIVSCLGFAVDDYEDGDIGGVHIAPHSVTGGTPA